MPMPDAADRPLRALLDEVAARSPAPGGGSVAAWTCAFAAGLVEMASRFAGDEPATARAAELRAQALALAERDLGAYAPVLAARRLPDDDPARAERIDAALSDAAEPPLAVARAAAEVAELAAQAIAAATSQLAGDARTGLLLADGACHAAASLVTSDLAGRPDDPRLTELATLTARAARARALAPRR